MKTKKIITLFIAGILGIYVVNAQDVETAKDFIDNERFSSAESILETSTGSTSENPEANYLLVKTYLEQDKKEEVKNFVDNHLKSAKNEDAEPLNRVAYARWLFSSGDKNQADQILQSIAGNKKNQKNSSLMLTIAEVYADEKNADPRLAFPLLDMAAKRDKNNPDIDLVRGQAYRRLIDGSSAFAAYQNALKKDASNVKALYLTGKIFTTQKNPEIYSEYFLKAYAIDSTYAPVLDELYKYYYYRNIPLAKKYLVKYIANSDYSLENEYNLTDILYLNNEYEKAITSANELIKKEVDKTQPRLYKLIAYSYAKAGDSSKALQNITTYFSKEDPKKYNAADFELRGMLTENIEGSRKETIDYYSIAADIDTIAEHKVLLATKIAQLYKDSEDYNNQAVWLGKIYFWKEKPNNLDVFNWGLAYYAARDYQKTDSIFTIYSERYPEEIFGYYWRAQANAAIDTNMTQALAIPHYKKVVEIGEKDTTTNRKMLLKAYGYLGGYEANISKDYPKSLSWFEKYLLLDKDNADVLRYAAMLRKYIDQKK